MYIQQAYLDACLHDGNSQWMYHLCNFSCGFVLIAASQKAPASWFSEQKLVRYVMISYMEKGNEKCQILKTDILCKTVNLIKHRKSQILLASFSLTGGYLGYLCSVAANTLSIHYTKNLLRLSFI